MLAGYSFIVAVSAEKPAQSFKQAIDNDGRQRDQYRTLNDIGRY